MNARMYPYISTCEIDGKKHKLLLLANSIDNASEIVKDYVELTFTGAFRLCMIKEYDDYLIIIDYALTNPLNEMAELVLDEELYIREEREQLLKDNEGNPPAMKFYKIKARVTYSDNDDKNEMFHSFIVKTYTAERGIMLINNYLNKEEDRIEKEAKERGNTFKRKEITAVIEESGIIPVNDFIPRDFSEAYHR